ncbi:MAG: divalent-cation tolerance protein CutA [Candidatus Thermoplasmatota archaeon]|nr:divalent-cation tolerance protein CutA [Candidatus Thermoplasmatota archaeon]
MTEVRLDLPMYAMLYMTAGDAAEARSLVLGLIERGLVACGNIFPIQSIYRWKGRIEEAQEVAVIMKTRRELVDRAITAARDAHSYEVPCVVAYAMETGSADYLRWIDDATSGE